MLNDVSVRAERMVAGALGIPERTFWTLAVLCAACSGIPEPGETDIMHFGGPADDTATAIRTVGDDWIVAGSLGTLGGVLDHAPDVAGNADAFLAKIGSNDNEVHWVTVLGGPGSWAAAYALGASADFNAIGGSFSGEFRVLDVVMDSGSWTQAFVVGVGPDGDPGWSQHFSGTGSSRVSTVALGERAVFVGGFYTGVMVIEDASGVSSGEFDSFVARLDASTGDVVWSHRFGGLADDYVNALEIDGQGNLIVVGSFRETVDFGCGSPAKAEAAVQPYILKVEGDTGECEWLVMLDTAGQAEVSAISISNTGEALVGVRSEGVVQVGSAVLGDDDGWTASILGLDVATGDLSVVSSLKSVEGLKIVSIARDEDRVSAVGWFLGDLIVSGELAASARSYDVFGVTLGAEYEYQSVWSAGGPGEDVAWSTALSEGRQLTAGSFQRTATFGSLTRTAAGGRDAFVLELR